MEWGAMRDRILIVDADPGHLKLAADVLAHFGQQISPFLPAEITMAQAAPVLRGEILALKRES